MTKKRLIIILILTLCSLSAISQAAIPFFGPIRAAEAAQAVNSVTPSDLISLINGMRVANGLGALGVDSALMASAQNTAATMAQNNMSWHIGDASGRVSAFGYNNGNKSFASENFAIGPTTLSSIQATWSDYEHMIPAANPAYCHIGAGVAEANGKVYYVIQAAYPGNSKGCGYAPGSGASGASSGSGTGSAARPIIDMSQIIASIKIATPNAEGQVIHAVENGQSLWSIASAYKVTIEDIAAWNNIVDVSALSLEQRLLIPEVGSAGRAPTPTALPITLPTPDAQGRYIHVINEGDTLTTVAKLWGTTIQELMRWNGLDETSTLGLSWKLIIPVTPTVTLPPTLTPLPSDTPQPSATPTLTPVPSMTATAKPLSRTHFPKSSGRTFLISSGFLLMLTAGTFAICSYFYRKPKKKKKAVPRAKKPVQKKI